MNEIANLTVIVGEGSGCLYKTNSQEYDYVLTAKHNVEGKEDLKVIRQYIDEFGNIIPQELKIIGVPFLHSNKDKDAAIIKIENLENLEALYREEYNRLDSYELIGHPDTRKDQKFSFRSNTLKVKNIKEFGYVEAEINKACTYGEILGQSGGGVIRQTLNKTFLVGIQRRMSVDDEIEMLSRIDFMPITFYDEIIEQYHQDLEKITLSFLECFSSLKNQVMPLTGALVENHVKFTRNFLRSITDKIVSNKLTPIYIKDFFEERLLIHNQSKNSLNHKKLWLAWLEFLIIMNIYQTTQIDDSTIEDLFNSHRLIFSNTEEDWSTELENIIKSDFKGLHNDGKIIISTINPPVISVIPADYVTDIIREQSIPRDELMIDEASDYPLVGHKLIHLTAFQRECIIAKSIEYKDYSTLDENQLKAKLKEEYKQLFA
ncbi:ABC-three component system protein [Spirosoma gilvum]